MTPAVYHDDSFAFPRGTHFWAIATGSETAPLYLGRDGQWSCYENRAQRFYLKSSAEAVGQCLRLVWRAVELIG